MVYIYSNNVEQNDIIIINLFQKMSLYCPVKCCMRTRVTTNVGLSHKLKRHHYRLEHLNETSCKV